MKILHIAPLTLKKSAGLTYSIPSFVEAQNSIDGIEAKILVSINTKNGDNRFLYLDQFKTKVDLKTFLSTFDIAIFHSTYILNHLKLARLLKKLNIPYVIVPRGGFTKNSKNIKWMKKAIGDMLFFNKFFKSPLAVHYLTHNERKNSVYSTNNDFVLPNGIQIPKESHKKNTRINSEKLTIVYIGRIDVYIKGLDVLFEAIKIIKKELLTRGILIELFGPSERESALKINEMIKNLEISDVVQIFPPLYDNEKFEKLRSTDIFIQTSRFEGLPMGVLEALSHGVPCILTPGTNLSKEVSNWNAGIEVEFNPVSISAGLLTIFNNYSLLDEMEKNALRLAKQYSWGEIAESSIGIYRNLIKKGRQ